jgi:hypothetical protein
MATQPFPSLTSLPDTLPATSPQESKITPFRANLQHVAPFPSETVPEALTLQTAVPSGSETLCAKMAKGTENIIAKIKILNLILIFFIFFIRVNIVVICT